VQPFAAWSANVGPLSPHINLGYQWNGDSVLAGEPGSGLSEDLPDVAVYSAGAVIELHNRVTAAIDLLGRFIIDSPRLTREDFHALDGTSVYPNITFERGSFNELSAAAGLKINTVGRMLLNLNLLVRLNSVGLRDKISPLIGVEYAF
jgi:hypothetical protein